MEHYAKVENGIVTQVFVVTPVSPLPVIANGQWIQTDYYTKGNVHYGLNDLPDGGTPLRGNFARVGFTYDSENDVFYTPQPYPSWTLNTSTWLWEAPIPMPVIDGEFFTWSESDLNWVNPPIKE